MFGNNLREIRNVLKQLKREFGCTVIFRVPIVNDVNITTGELTREYLDIQVRRTIILPTKTDRSYVYDLAYVMFNKNFTAGGFFDRTVRDMIVLKSDLKNNTPNLEWVCTYKDRKYCIKEIAETEDNSGYLLKCKALDEE